MNLGIDMTQQWIATAHISLLLLNSPCTPKTKIVLVVCILKKTIVRLQESGYYY
jgi:hypothetical protein